MSKPKILMADDDRDILETNKFLLSDSYDIEISSTVEEAKVLLMQFDFDAAIIDLNFEGQRFDGISLIDYIHEEKPNTSIIVLSSDQNTKRVVEATRRHLVDFITKDEDSESAIRQALSKVLTQKSSIKQNNTFEFKTKSPLVKKLLLKVDQVLMANSTAPILILGESGTGKEFLAKYIGSKLNQKLIAANMASVPKETAESELFGHKKGSFTGAISDKAGLLEQAHNGVFFLDEIGDCSAAIQAKLLRVIQEKEILPVGGLTPKKINLRFIAATHRDLEKMVTQEEFRLDLYQRLNAFVFTIPPLRERAEDIEYYARIFVNEFTKGESFRIEESGLEILKQQKWDGNVRELSNIIQRIVVFSKRRCLDQASALEAINNKTTNTASSSETKDYGPEQILDALQRAKGNRTIAATLLDMHKTTLHRYINKYRLRESIEARSVGRPPVVLA